MTEVTKVLTTMESTAITNIINIALLHDTDPGASFQTMNKFAERYELDTKQKIAFEGICSSFMLSYLSDMIVDNYDFYESQLRQRGGRDQLLMFLTGPGGSGKTYVVHCSRLYCKLFCRAIGKPFYKSTFAVSGVTHLKASIAREKTVHFSALMQNKVLYNELLSDFIWLDTKILIVEGISTAQKSFLVKLDAKLRELTHNNELLYGGINIVFVGDFLQLRPVVGKPIYDDFGDIHWHGSLNSCVMLDQGLHRFKKDPEWGEILSRIYCGYTTEEDINKINARIVGQVNLPDNVDCMETRVAYACLTNACRNQVIYDCFLRYVRENSPPYNSDIEPSNSVVLIKGIVSRKGDIAGSEFHQILWTVGNDHNVIGFNNIKVDPCLKLFYGCPLQISCNTGTKGKIIFKETTVNFAGVKWKEGYNPDAQNYQGHKVMSGTVDDVNSLLVQFQGGAIKEVKAEKFSCTIKFEGNDEKLSGLEITQFPLNIALAATLNKMEGQTKDIMIVVDQTVTLPGWMYFVLSRVNSRNGLFLLQPVTREMLMPLSLNIEDELMWLRMLENEYIRHLRVHE